MKTKTIEITAWALVDYKGTIKATSDTKEALVELNGSCAIIKLTGTYEVPEQTITVSESQIDQIIEDLYKQNHFSFSSSDFKKALGFK